MSPRSLRIRRWLRRGVIAVAALPLLQATGCALTDAIAFELSNLGARIVGQAAEILAVNFL